MDLHSRTTKDLFFSFCLTVLERGAETFKSYRNEGVVHRGGVDEGNGDQSHAMARC